MKTWTRLIPSREGTHHLDLRGEPAYAARFDEVLGFRKPGLAPVRKDGKAWHITPDGSAAYPGRHFRTFGFYEWVAAVDSIGGWFHIRPDGSALYPARYAWCGNFQGGRCAVRNESGAYFHITPSGERAYGKNWKYAGDFRNGIAVVQADNGQSTHIDSNGGFLHRGWFLDLDVFHKGYARARDHEGWMHIDICGAPRYRRRFAAVEPFYNGQARVERFDGGLEVVNESGACLVELRSATRF